jgi:hypothetical protein
LNVLFAVLLKEIHELEVVSIKGQPLHHMHIKHVRELGVPDGKPAAARAMMIASIVS